MNNKKVVLVLEDTQERIDWIRSALPECEVKATKNVDEFVAWSTQPHCMAVFDHDLDEAHYGGYAAEQPLTGYDAATKYGGFDQTLLVWSWNPIGAKRITALLAIRQDDTYVVQRPFATSASYRHLVRNLAGLLNMDGEKQPNDSIL